MYSVHDHGAMIADHIRVSAYRQAMEQRVRPGTTVVDIGTGTGLFAVFACKFGARKVYAIECDDVIDLARQIARDNGCSDRIEFIRDMSTNVQLPEKADLIISDVHGALPVYRSGPESLIDARRRFLTPNGTMIPLRDQIWVSVVNLTSSAYDEISVWSDRRWNVDLSAGTRFGYDWPIPTTLRLEDLVSGPQSLITLDYLALDSSSVSGNACWTMTKDAEANGYGLWSICELCESVTLTTAPGQPKTAYPNQFAPWSKPLQLRAGDRIEAQFSFKLVRDRYIWVWNTRVVSPDGTVKEEFRQSNLSTMFVTTDELRKGAPDYTPVLSSKGEAARAALQLMDGIRTHEQIARMLVERIPGAFRDEREALAAVAEISMQFGR